MEFVGHEIFISRVTYPSIRNVMLSSKKYTLWGLKCNREVMRAQKSEIQKSRLKKILYLVLKKLLSVVFIWNWKSFLQLFSKLILKLVISFMNRKSSCGYATHFFSCCTFCLLIIKTISRFI
jgi:hypothetical protein